MKTLVSLLVLFTAANVWGAAVYPVTTPDRYLGAQQGNTGSCAAEAEVGALEHAFAARGMSVRLSTYYTHAFNWKGQSSTSKSDITQTYAPADTDLFNRLGPIIPAFMLPEDGRGFRPESVGDRLPISQSVIDGTGFPGPGTYGFQEQFMSFHPGYSNTVRDIGALKAAVAQRLAVTLSIDAEILHMMDKFTGLLNQPYVTSAFYEKVKAYDEKEKQKIGTNHAVAVVGFDDSLYADQGFPNPGAFIIRNSWNENGYVSGYFAKIDKSNPAQAQMRAKISPEINEPGYYALPYQYVIDLINRQNPGERVGDGGYQILNINFNAFYSYYVDHSGKYEILRVPYVCNWDRAQAQVRRFAAIERRRSSAQGEALAAATIDLRDFINRQRLNAAGAAFQYATISRLKDGRVDRAADLYEGRLNSFYCSGAIGPVIPEAIRSLPEFKERVREVSLDPQGSKSWMRFFQFLTSQVPKT